MLCDDCSKDFYFDCDCNPCRKLIAWEELDDDDRLQEKYDAKGVVMNWVRLDGTRPPPPANGGRRKCD